jgi:protein-export membrane protein SecD
MQRNPYIFWLIPILLVFAFAIWIDTPNPSINFKLGDNEIKWSSTVHQGLDLQGGLQVLLEADLAAGQTVEQNAINTAKDVIERRVNGLGVTEPVVQVQGDRRISVELPGLDDVDQAIALVQQTALLEFVDTGVESPAAGTTLATDANKLPLPAQQSTPYHTIFTGAMLKGAGVRADQLGNPAISFELTDEGATIFAKHTAANIGRTLAIVLDGKVLSAPQINSEIPDGKGEITGRFSADSANQLALSLRYGSLPIPLKVVNSRSVGATLGQDSVNLSILAGIVGFGVVGLFMVLYYRLPGLVAVLALAIYAAVSFALFKLIPITLTLPGIAGFILSLGVAVDANILVFERLREELRAGKTLWKAMELGFQRAWPSIRDSNISTLITCSILFFFGNTFGASIVKGFALTLAVGVLVGLFSAILATRALMFSLLGRMEYRDNQFWFGAE